MLKAMFVGDCAAGRSLLEQMAKSGGVQLAAIAGPLPHAKLAASAWQAHYFTPHEIIEAKGIERISKLALDLIVNFNSTVIFPSGLLNLPKIGAINFHPGILPEFAGLNVQQWAIFDGLEEFGATLHWMEPGIDTGRIIKCVRVPIAAEDTGLTLFLKLLKAGALAFSWALDELASGKDLPTLAQDLSKRRYFGKAAPNDGVIDFSWSCRKILDLVRALSYRPFISPSATPAFFFRSQRIEVVAAGMAQGLSDPDDFGRVREIGADGCVVCAADGLIRITKIFHEEKIESAESAAKSLRLSKGDRLGPPGV